MDLTTLVTPIRLPKPTATTNLRECWLESLMTLVLKRFALAATTLGKITTELVSVTYMESSTLKFKSFIYRFPDSSSHSPFRREHLLEHDLQLARPHLPRLPSRQDL